MATIEQYRQKVLELRALARSERDPRLVAEWGNLAECYARLAEQAERNSKADLTYEPPPIRLKGH